MTDTPDSAETRTDDAQLAKWKAEREAAETAKWEKWRADEIAKREKWEAEREADEIAKWEKWEADEIADEAAKLKAEREAAETAKWEAEWKAEYAAEIAGREKRRAGREARVLATREKWEAQLAERKADEIAEAAKLKAEWKADEIAKRKADYAAESADDRRRRRQNLLADARPSIGAVFHAAVDDTLLETPAVLAARSFRDRRKRVLMLCGGTGSGKTTAAAYLLAHLSRIDWTTGREKHNAFVASYDLVRHASAADREDWNRLVSANLLVVDEMGAEADPAKFAAALRHLINARLWDGRVLVITSHLSLAEQKERYPDPLLWDRLEASCEVHEDDSPSMRVAPEPTADDGFS